MNNQLPRREKKRVITGPAARTKLLAGAKQLYDAVSSVYGPGSGNAVLDLPFGDPTLTHDGVTVAKRVSDVNIGLPDRGENLGAAILRQASAQTNKTAGDGTTATVVLGYNLLEAANQQLSATSPEKQASLAMRLMKQMKQDALTITGYLKSVSTDINDASAKFKEGGVNPYLLDVAKVSSGDENIGMLVAETLQDVGLEGGITIREQSYPTLDVERVNGYYFEKGCFYLNVPVEYNNPHILVSQRRIASNSDIVPILSAVAESNNKRLVIIGEVSGDAVATIVQNAMKGIVETVVVPPPMYGEESKLFMEDIAIYVGSQILTEADNVSQIKASDFGSAARVQTGPDRAIIFGGAGGADAITSRAAEIKSVIDKESNAHKKSQLEGRYQKLVGKIAIVNVGGSTPTEMEEIRFRVEDAIEAVKSAMQDGVLPGGATMLVKAATLANPTYIAKGKATASEVAEALKGGNGRVVLDDPKDVQMVNGTPISPLFVQALEATFMKLMDNAGESASYRLKQVQDAKFGHGFNLRDMTDEPVDLTKTGIWDATRAVVQTIENAASAAGAILTSNTIVEIVEPDEKATT